MKVRAVVSIMDNCPIKYEKENVDNHLVIEADDDPDFKVSFCIFRIITNLLLDRKTL